MNKSATTGRALYWFFSAVVVVLAFRWVPFGVDWTIPAMAYHMESRAPLLYFHMIASAVPMAFIPFQISNKFRMRHTQLHRYMGWASMAGIYLGGLTLFGLVPYINIPVWGQAGFFSSGLLWVGAGTIGLYHILNRNTQKHRWWMMITATILFGAVTQRLALPIWISVGFPFKIAYSLSPWTAWTVNLALFFLWQYRRKWTAALGIGRKSRA